MARWGLWAKVSTACWGRGAAGVFVPEHVAQPVDVVFHTPVAAHEHGQARGWSFGGAAAGDVVAGAGGFFAALFVRGFAPGADGLGDVGEGGALAPERDGAQLALDEFAAAHFRFGGKKGAPASCAAACAASVGWLSLRLMR